MKQKSFLSKYCNNKMNWKVWIICFFLVFLAAAIGSSFTNNQVNSQWYQSIKPSITPPNFVFPIVWTILYILISISLYLSYESAKTNNEKKVISIAFTVNLYFNILWSVLYFGQQNILGAFIDLIFLWISILVLFTVTYKINKLASYLLIPYFIWVTFAGLLNYLSLNLI